MITIIEIEMLDIEYCNTQNLLNLYQKKNQSLVYQISYYTYHEISLWEVRPPSNNLRPTRDEFREQDRGKFYYYYYYTTWGRQ